MHLQSGPCNLVPSSGDQSSQQAFRSDPQVPFHHRRTSSSFSQSRPEDGSDVVSSLGSGYDSTRITGSVAQDRHTMRFPPTTTLPGTVLATPEDSSPLVVGGRRKTQKSLDPATPPYYYKQLPPGQTFPVQGDSTPQYFSFWDMTTPPNTSASPPETLAPASSARNPSLMQDFLPASSDENVVQGLHTGFVQCPPLPWLVQPIHPFPTLQTTNLQATQSARPWNTDGTPRAPGNTSWASVTDGNTPQGWAPRRASRQDQSVHQNFYTNRFQRRDGPPQHLDELQRGDARFIVSGIPGGIWGRDQTSWSSTRGLGGHSAPSRPSIPSDGSDQARANSWEPQHDTASSAPVRTKNRTKQAQRRAKALETSVAQDAPPKTSKANKHKLPQRFQPNDRIVDRAIVVDWRTPLTPSKVTQRVTSERPEAEVQKHIDGNEGRKRSRSL